MEKPSAQEVLEEAFIVSKLIMKYQGFWPLDPLRYSEIRTTQEKLLWVVGWFFLLFVPITFAMDIMYIATMDKFDPVELTDAGASMMCNFYITMVVTNVNVKQDKWRAAFEELYTFGDPRDLRGYKQMKDDAKVVKKLSIALTIANVLAVVGYLSMPIIQSYQMHKVHTDEGIPPLFIFKQWYPYDKNQSPYYEISLFIECIRCVDCCLAVGVDCMFNGILILVIGQFKLLHGYLKNIRQTALNNLGCANQELNADLEEKVDRELETLLGVYVRFHNKLFRMIDLIQDTFGFVILMQTILHAIVVCFVLYQMMVAIDTGDYFSFFKYLFYQIVLVIQMFVYGYYGSNLINESQEVATAIFHSDWYLIKNRRFKQMLRMVMRRAQKPCVITAMGFAVLSLELFMNIMSSAGSYFALLQTLSANNQ